MFRNLLIKSQFKRTLCSANRKKIDWDNLKFKSKVPSEPVESIFSEKTERVKLTEEEIVLLEKLSLVDLDRTKAVSALEDSIEFASKIFNIETDESVKPLYTVLEDYQLQLREDKVTDGNIKKDVMSNAAKTEEDTYFITPK